VIAEATAVEARGRISPKDAGIWSDEHVEPWARVARFVSEYGAVPGIQLAHAGRKASTTLPWLRGGHDTSLGDEEGGWEPVAPSAIAYRSGSRIPHELTIPDIIEIQTAFGTAAKRVKDAGFRWLELHFAQGYLAHSFLSPLSNRRTDRHWPIKERWV
jgi:2,4-dienoyl-CoA reductase-like NADH-dependent reductase (Old Yellow Enzyme family)